MEVGMKVWARGGPQLWEPGIIVQKSLEGDKFNLNINLNNGESKQYKVSRHDDDIDDLKLRNVEGQANLYEGSDLEDLTHLTHLHEPAILYSLHERYLKKNIYTYTGTILLAVNPFQKVDLYTDEVLNKYRSDGERRLYDPNYNDVLPPHVYALADKSYRNMSNPTTEYAVRSQSILVSGESGAGKTETCKIIMKYVAMLARAHNDDGPGDGIENQVLQSNPILEAFGNARTVRNDNSSRFGKYIQILFTDDSKLFGATIKTFLLEKVRVTKQGTSERNYHIFYALHAGSTSEQRKRWDLKDPKLYHYTNQSHCYDRRDKVPDSVVYKELMEAFDVMGVTDTQYMGCFDVVAAILALGNVTFEPIRGASEDNARCKVAKASEPYLMTVARLLGVEEMGIVHALTSRNVTAGLNYQVKIYQDADQSNMSRDALAKAIYSSMFEWIVKRTNASMDSTATTDITSHKSEFSTDMAFIGLLDIFGFEIFKDNYFEQFLINYANEMLQQLFNDFVFSKEQEDYGVEQIEWTFISFPDNRDVITMIEDKPFGVIPCLDEQCLLGQPSDERFARELYKKCEGKPSFIVTNKMRANHQFQIRHYAGEVLYSSKGMIEKNRDALAQEGVDLLLDSINPFVVLMGEIESAAPANVKKNTRMSLARAPSIKRQPSRMGTSKDYGVRSGPRRSMIGAKSLGTQFKESLSKLVKVIQETYPHFVRCIKPNDTLVPGDFNHERIAEQLRNAGVLEVVRVARAGFPVRLQISEFIQRYGMLAPTIVEQAYRRSSRESESDQERFVCKELIFSVLSLANKEDRAHDFATLCRENGLQMGLTKIFFQNKAFNKVEKLRTIATSESAIKIQSAWRRYSLRLKYLILKGVIKPPEKLKEEKRQAANDSAALRIQTITRAFLAKKAQEAEFLVQLNMQRETYEGRILALNNEIAALHAEIESLKSRPARFIVVAAPLGADMEADTITETILSSLSSHSGSDIGAAKTLLFEG